MSQSAYSSASSPDILGTPGDAEYLISSPIKPFSGRQSAMSPANYKLMQTPRTASRPRASLTPGGRSAHSIRFDDVLLPASPSMKLDGGQMALSPDKLPTDGNASPWRIRVTLEATQDDDEMAVDSPRKRLRPTTTTTTKIPLKGEEAPVEETPRRRRGRPRKSELAQDATPVPGSPGHTPGPVGASGQKRKRGRPRKNTPVWEAAQQTSPPEARMDDIQEVQEDQRVQEIQDNHDDLMEDIHNVQQLWEARGAQEVQEPRDAQEDWRDYNETDQRGVAEPEQSFSPLNMAADADSDDDDLPDQDYGAPFENPAQEHLGGAHEDRSSPRVRFEQTFDTPHVDSPDEPYMANGNGHWGSTPSKMPSPSHERKIVSPDNTLHAGHTPMPPRTYPTPTSSSLVDGEKREPTTDGPRQDESQPTNPTDEQREFDSIIESEGFSMVSLDTLPSAKQHGLEGQEGSKIGKSALRRVWNQDTIGSLQRRPSKEPDTTSKSRSRQSSKEPRATRHSREPSNRPGPSSGKTKPVKSLSPVASPPATSGAKSTIQGGLVSTTPLRQVNSNRKPRSPSTMMKRRMEEWQMEREAISREIQRANTSQIIVIGSDDGASLVPGDEHAHEPSNGQDQEQDQEEPEIDRAAPFETLADPADDFSGDDADDLGQIDDQYVDQYDGHYQDENPDGYPDEYLEDKSDPHQDLNRDQDLQEQYEPEAHRYQSPEQGLDVMDDQYYQDLDLEGDDEYNRYRELDLGPDSNDDDHYDDDGDLDQGQEPNEDQYQDPNQNRYRELHESPTQGQDANDVQYPDLDHHQAGDEDQYLDLAREKGGFQDQFQNDGSEEDDDEDIWQQEAHNQSAHSHRSPVTYDRAGQESGPRENGLTNTPGEQAASSPDYWITKREKVPFLGQSRVRQLREQNVDFSNYLRAENTPRRSRYYNGSPMSAAKPRLQSSPSAKASQHGDAHGSVPENKLQSDGFLESSPRLSDDEAFQVDPTTRHENAWQLALAQRDEDEYGNEGIPDAAVAEQQSTHETHGVTPERQPANAELPASSLFRRIASLTPGWLKAPIRRSPGRPSPPVREKSSEGKEPEEVETPAVAAEDTEQDEEEPPADEVDNHDDVGDTPRPPPQVASADHGRHSSATPRPGQMLDHEHASPGVGTGETYERPFPLALSGYFSDDHYAFLRRLYRLAKRYPERFPYHPSAGRTGIIGDWIWTSDGVHGVPITERQFAIIDRFVQELAKADLQAGGTGQVGWTEADVHRRLISIIIGEEIRKERKAGMHEEQPRALSRRATAARPWR